MFIVCCCREMELYEANIYDHKTLPLYNNPGCAHTYILTLTPLSWAYCSMCVPLSFLDRVQAVMEITV